MIPASPAPFEKYQRRLLSGSALTVSLYIVINSFSLNEPTNLEPAIELLNELIAAPSAIIYMPIIVFSIYTFGYFFESLIIGILVPSASKFMDLIVNIKDRINNKINNKIISTILSTIILIFIPIFSSIFIFILAIKYYILDLRASREYAEDEESNQTEGERELESNAIDQTLSLCRDGHYQEIEKLAHIALKNESQKAFVFKKLEEVKTNLSYTLSIFSILYSFVVHADPTLPYQMFYENEALTSIVILFFSSLYITTLGIFTSLVGIPQYTWILHTIEDFASYKDAP